MSVALGAGVLRHARRRFRLGQERALLLPRAAVFLAALAVTGGTYARYVDDRSSLLTFLALFAIAVTAAYIWFRKR